MGSAKLLAITGIAAIVFTQTVNAADYPPPQPVYQPPQPVYQPPPQYYPPPPPPVYQQPLPPPVYQPAPAPIFQQSYISDFSGWYLRGDIGVGAQRFSSFDFVQTNPVFVWPASWRIDQKDIKDTTFFAIGAGYQFNTWFRSDVTAEYRQSTKVKALGSYTEFCPGGARCFDMYDGDHQASVFMLNAYLDLGTWWCVTPFVSIGIGTAYHQFDAWTDIGFIADGSTGFGLASASSSDWTFAWQVQAGLAFEITKSLKLELAYRYLDLGSPATPIINCNSVGCAGNGPRAYYTLTDLTSRELKLGLRWMFDVPPPAPLPMPIYAPPPPLVRKG